MGITTYTYTDSDGTEIRVGDRIDGAYMGDPGGVITNLTEPEDGPAYCLVHYDDGTDYQWPMSSDTVGGWPYTGWRCDDITRSAR